MAYKDASLYNRLPLFAVASLGFINAAKHVRSRGPDRRSVNPGGGGAAGLAVRSGSSPGSSFQIILEEFPDVAEVLPPPPGQKELAILEEELQKDSGRILRPEVIAARLVREASGELAKGARVDLRRDVRLVFTAWYSGLHESNMAVDRIWPDASKAFGRGFTGPSAAVALQSSLPLGALSGR